MNSNRRDFLAAGSLIGVAGVGTWGAGWYVAGAANDDAEKTEVEISAPEDLMREHGVLNRILIIYEEGLRRLHANEAVPPEVFHQPATLVRQFVEDYHERL